MTSTRSRTRARRIRPFENRTAVLADLENPARGTRRVAAAMEDLERLIMRAAPAELGPMSVIYSCERSIFGESSRLCSKSQKNWRYLQPLPDPDGKNGPDNALAIALELDEFVRSSQRVMILGGDGKLAKGAQAALDRGSIVYLLALEDSVHSDLETLPGLTVVKLPILGSI